MSGGTVNTNGKVPRPDEMFAEGLVVLIGVLLGTATVLSWLWLDIEAFDAFIVAIPALILIVLMGVVRYSSLPPHQYPETLRGTIAGLVVMGGFIFVVLLTQGDSLVNGVPLLLFMMGFGASGGLLVGLFRGQSKRTRQQAETLKRQQDRLVFLNQLLRHNVLNNLAIINGYTETLDEEYDIEEPYLDIIQDNSQDVEELVNNVRVLVRTVTTETALEPVDLADVLRTEVDSLRRREADLEIRTTVPDTLSVYADGLLRYAIQNLLHNAVEHNDADVPQIEITVEQSDNEVEVIIADNGPGIPASTRDGLTASELEANHGVGLYLVKTLVNEYGGSFNITDNSPRGTRISISLDAASDTTRP